MVYIRVSRHHKVAKNLYAVSGTDQDWHYFKNGTNVNFYKIINRQTIQVKTYEKGVEKIMQSCGSGSYACAYDYSKKNNIKGKIKVLNDGGISQITFSKCYQNNLFRAIANIEYEGALEI